VLAFEQHDDAQRFATMLAAESFDLATPLEWDSEQLANFCHSGNYQVSLVPNGGFIMPPSKNEYDTDAFQRLNNPNWRPEQAGPEQAGPERYGEPERGPGDLDPYAQVRDSLERLFNDQ
jgi:hypothetical protein